MRAISQHFRNTLRLSIAPKWQKLANIEMVNMLSADLMARSWRNAPTLTSSLPLAPHICVFVVKVDPPRRPPPILPIILDVV